MMDTPLSAPLVRSVLSEVVQFPLPVAERYNPSPLGRVMSFTKKGERHESRSI
jgi:hypothetical protein